MKVGDLVKTKIPILNNRIPKNKYGLVVEKSKISFSEHSYNIVKVRFFGEVECFAYKEEHLEVMSEGQ